MDSSPSPTGSGYRPVSGLAVAALALGGLSALALTGPFLWALPPLGVLLAALALADVSREGAEKAGRAAALAGLALSVGFGAQALTARWIGRRIMEERATAVANAWLDCIRDGRLIDARGMVVPDMFAPPSPLDLAPAPDAPPPEPPEAEFARMPVVARIAGCGGGASRTLECEELELPEATRWQVRVRLAPCAEGGSLGLRLELEARRNRRSGEEQWLVAKFEAEP